MGLGLRVEGLGSSGSTRSRTYLAPSACSGGSKATATGRQGDKGGRQTRRGRGAMRTVRFDALRWVRVVVTTPAGSPCRQAPGGVFNSLRRRARRYRNFQNESGSNTPGAHH